MSSYTSISCDKLARLIGTANAPALVDVRIDEDFDSDPRLIPGSVRRSHRDTEEWAAQLAGRPAIVVCQKGQKLSEGTAALLRARRVSAEILDGGFADWEKARLPLVPAGRIPVRDGRGRTVWVTRARPTRSSSQPARTSTSEYAGERRAPARSSSRTGMEETRRASRPAKGPRGLARFSVVSQRCGAMPGTRMPDRSVVPTVYSVKRASV